MSTRWKVVLGSLIGALAINFAFMACLGPPPSDSAGNDGGIGGMLEAAVDALQTLMDSTMMPARAGTDAGEGGGGTATCSCPAGGGVVDGTRLKGLYTSGSDGSKVYDTTGRYWDSMLGTECRGATYSDGNTYCIPSSTAAVAFTDSACTQPLLYTSTGTPLPAYGYGSVRSGGAESTALTNVIYKVGTPVTAPSNVYVLNVYGGCYAGGTSFDFFQVGSTVSPSTFVTLTSNQHD